MMQSHDRKYALHVMGYHSEKFGSLERFILELARQARSENLEMIFVFNSKPWSEEFLTALKDNEIAYYISNAMSPLAFYQLFYKLTKKYQPIIVHSHFQPLLPSFYGWLLGYKYRWNKLHLMLTDSNTQQVTSKKQLKISSRVYRTMINLFTNKFFCVSEAVLKQYFSVYPSQNHKLQVLYNGVRDIPFNKIEARANLGFDADTIYFGSIVFANKTKGVDILMQAFQIFTENNPYLKVRLCLIGLAPNADITIQVHQMISKYGLVDKVIDFGIINNVPEVLPAMDIYIQPSRTESLSYALIEAGLFEIPAIGVDVGGIPEVLLDGKTGFLFPVGDVNALADKMQVLVDDKFLREKMGKASRVHKLETFDLQKNVSLLLSEYKKVIST